jgi:penicillin-binding protein 2
VLTYLMDPERAMRTLTALEEGWGGDLLARTARLAEQTNQPPAPAPSSTAPAPVPAATAPAAPAPAAAEEQEE